MRVSGSNKSSTLESSGWGTRRLPSQLALMLLVLSLLVNPGLAQSVRADDATSPVFFSGHGKCAMTYRDDEPLYCRISKWGNVYLTPYVAPRPGEWGIAYAYNCGVKPKTFAFVVDFSMWDQTASKTAYAVRARHGRGFLMETGNDAVSLPVDENEQIATGLESVVIRTSCRWSVLGVDGSSAVVAQYVPQIPKRS